MACSAIWLVLLICGHRAYGQDVVTVSGVDTVTTGGGGGGKGEVIDVTGEGDGTRRPGEIPDDGLLPKWCQSEVGKKCDVPYDIGIFDEATATACLVTCQMKSCLSAQYHEGKCMLSTKRCETLVPGDGINFYRLKEGEEGMCPGGTSPVGIKEYQPINEYCKGVGVECPGEDIVPARYTPTLRQCVTDCNVDRRCLNVHYRDKICHLRAKRCTKDQLIPAPGAIDLYRLMKGETCPTDRPPYVEIDMNYSGKFCMMKGKSCPGHNLYPRPWKLSMHDCLVKCNRIKSCGTVDFFGGRCDLKDYRCEDDELQDAPETVNLMRLREGEDCPGNREPPPVLKPWVARFCQKKGRECKGSDMKNMPVDAVDIVDCLTKCVKAEGCATVFFKDGKCTLKDKNCEEKDLKESDGDTYYRLRAGEGCPDPPQPPTCQENAAYDPEGPGCPNTCEDRDAQKTCPVESFGGCHCGDGFVKAPDSDACIPISDCGCKDEDGNKHNVGDTWSSPDCKKNYTCLLNGVDAPEINTADSSCGENEECDGSGTCKCVEGYERKDDGKCGPVIECGPHSTFNPTAPALPNICHDYTREAVNSETKPGCPCNDGYILEKEGGQCVPYPDCGCKDDKGNSFQTGDEWLSEDCSKSHTCEAEFDGPPMITEVENQCPDHASCKADTGGRGECGCDEGYTEQPDGTCKPNKECPPPTTYNPKGSLCPNTCKVPNRASQCQNTGPSCDCPAGHVLNENFECVKASDCPCYDEMDKEREVGDEWMNYDCEGNSKCVADGDNVPKVEVTEHSCKENSVCDTSAGFSQCLCKEGFVLAVDGESCVPETPPCEQQLREKVKTFVEDILAILSGGCGSCSDTCQNPNGSKNCPSTSKICSCGKEGFLYDEVVGKCIPANECGCYDANGLPHAGGSSWLSDDCKHKMTCDAMGSGMPHVTREAFSCNNCISAGVCSDNESNLLPEPNVSAETIQNSKASTK